MWPLFVIPVVGAVGFFAFEKLHAMKLAKASAPAAGAGAKAASGTASVAQQATVSLQASTSGTAAATQAAANGLNNSPEFQAAQNILQQALGGLSGNQTGMVTTQTDPLKVRDQPTTSSNVLGTVAKGSIVQITGGVVGGAGSTSGWYPVQQGNLTGFASADFITIQ